MSSFEIMLYVTSFNTIFVILCFTYVYLKEKEYQAKRDIYAHFFEKINQEIHFLKKTINEQTKQISQVPRVDEKRINDNIKKQAVGLINEVIPPIVESIQKIDESFRIFKQRTTDAASKMEKKVQNYTDISPESIDNSQVLRLHTSGLSSDEISQKLGIPKGEIDFIIKMSNNI